MLFLKLIRWKNISLLAISQCLLGWFIFNHQFTDIPVTIYLFVFITFCFAGAGNIINDIFDFKADAINKPTKVLIPKKVNHKTANIYYTVLNVLGVIAVGLLYLLSSQWLSFTLLLIPIGLYIYSKFLKGKAIIGNITIASFTGVSIFYMILFKQDMTAYQQKWIIVLSVFSFLLNFYREIVKDVIDLRGDQIAGHKTLPILIGKSETKNVLKVVLGLIIISVLIIITKSDSLNVKMYYTAGIFAPLVYLYSKLIKAKKHSHYADISRFIKLIIAIGIGSLLIL